MLIIKNIIIGFNSLFLLFTVYLVNNRYWRWNPGGNHYVNIVEIGFNSLFLLLTFTLYIPICMEYVN